MTNIIDWLFPKKTRWIDISCFERMGHIALVQMRIEIKTNKKEFRIAKIGFINDLTVRKQIYESVLEYQCLDK